jgi:hypothetical protein
LTLKGEPDEAIELFDWCGAAALEREKLKLDLAASAAKLEELETSVNELKTQLDGLVKTKKDSEAELLQKFQDLLNEKKVKIRQQARLLSSATIDPSKIAPGPSGLVKSEDNQSTGGSRPSKRKVRAGSDDDDSSDGFEKMELDHDEKRQEDEDIGDRETTDGEETSSEADDDEPGPSESPIARRSKARAPSEAPPEEDKPTVDLPPKRTLPSSSRWQRNRVRRRAVNRPLARRAWQNQDRILCNPMRVYLIFLRLVSLFYLVS